MGANWTKEQERALLDGVGSFGWITLMRRTGDRSKAAILSKIKRMFGGGGITRGTYSLKQAIEETGYDRTQLKRAAQALGQRWNRTGKGSNHYFLITGEQLEAMIEWLKNDYWSTRKRIYKCTNCGTTSRPHFRVGCCSRCYKHLNYFSESRGLPFSIQYLTVVLADPIFESVSELEEIKANLAIKLIPNRNQLEGIIEVYKSDQERLFDLIRNTCSLPAKKEESMRRICSKK